MDRRFLKLHQLDDSNAFDYAVIEIDGSALTGTTADAGVVKGLAVAQAKDSSNTVTVTFREPFEYAPIVFYQPITANVVCQETSTAVDKIVYTTVEGADYSTGSADADVRILLIIPRGLGVI